MCGICGLYNLNKMPVDPELLSDMNQTLKHRGPDDEGYYINGAIGLGHRRLSIIDLNTGQQPVYNEDRSVVTVFNGEIYNFREIKALLLDKGHIFYTHTDTEVIVHSYEEWGEACVERFRGMFAFAVWDKNKQSLFLARDRLGIKPLYYMVDTSKCLCFASELKALLQDDSFNRELNLEAVSDYFSFGYIPAPKSIFRGIQKLPPGHTLTYKNNVLSIKKYWDIHFSIRSRKTEKQYCEHLIDTLRESVKLRLMSDVPLGAFLSGGIDSSVIVALMSELMDQPVVTNSVGFSVQTFNELDDARETSNYFKTDHNEFTLTPDISGVVDKLSWHYDEPFADSSSIPTYYVSQMTRENVTVALSGDGGDEIFAGYRRYYFDLLENNLRNLIPGPIRKYIIGSLAMLYPKADWLPQMFRAKTLLTNLSLDPVDGYFNSMSMISPVVKSKLFSNDLKKELKEYNSINVFREHYDSCKSKDPLSKIQYIDFKTYLPEDILTKVDRASMANSLEVRVPILDHKFVEFAATMPSDMKLKGGVSKFIFKKSAKTILPETIISRKKKGFSMPIGSWMKNELKFLLDDLLFEPSASNDLFNTKIIQTLWRDHVRGIKDNTQPLWTLLSFKLWEKKYL